MSAIMFKSNTYEEFMAVEDAIASKDYSKVMHLKVIKPETVIMSSEELLAAMRVMMEKVNQEVGIVAPRKKNRLVKPSKFNIAELTSKMLFHRNEPYSKSTVIAKYFGMRHDNLMRKIEEFHSFDEMVGSSKLRSQIYTNRGKEYPYYEMDADAFAFICLSLTGKKAEKFKWLFLEAFKVSTREALKNKMRAEIHLEDAEFVAVRNEGKITRLTLTDAVKELCALAEETRGKPYAPKKCPYFKHFTKLVYKTLGLKVPAGNVNRRDIYTKAENKIIDELEEEVADAIMQMIGNVEDYHDIYSHIKHEINGMGL